MFERRAKVLLAWEMVRPDSEEEFPEKPEYPQRPALPNNRASDAVIEAYEREVKNYQLELAEYRELNKEFEGQKLALRELSNLIIDTVSPELQRINCSPDDNLREWYSNLQKTCSASTVQKAEKAIRQYEELVDTRQKIKNPLEWLTKWEITMAESIKKEVAQAKTPVAWFNDLIRVLTPYDESFINAFKVQTRRELENRTLEFRTVSNDLKWHFSQKPAHTKRVAKGTFGPTFAEPESGPEEGSETGPSNPNSASLGKANKPTKRTRRAPQTNSKR